MESSKNVLFISYDGMTDPLGQSQVIPYLQGLSKNGYRFFIVSCEKKEAYQQNKKTVEQLLKDFPIEWIPISYSKNPPVISTLFDIYKLKRKAREICKEQNIQLVHTRPGIPSLVGYWLKNKLGVKFLNDIREFYADSRVDGGMWNKDHFLYKKIYQYFKKQEAKEIANADGIVCLTNAAHDIITNSTAYQSSTPISVIPCSTDLELFSRDSITKEQQNLLQKELGLLKDDFVISYLGSIGGWYLTAEMMQLCKMISIKIPAAKFLFISPNQHDSIIDTAEKFGLSPDRIVTKKASRKEVPALLSLSKYSLFFIKPCFSKLSSSPTKHGEIMAMGIPVITNSGVGDVEEIIKQTKSGIVIHQFNEDAYNEAIEKMLTTTTWDSNKIRASANQHYNLQTAIEKYTNLYDVILSNPSSTNNI